MKFEQGPPINSNEEPTNKAEKVAFSREEFEERFAEKLTTGENGIEYNRFTPEELITNKPVIFIGGFGQGSSTYHDELYDLAESGRDVIFSNPIRGVEGEKSDELLAFQAKYDLPDIIMNKVAAVEEIIRDLGAQEVDLAGHSQGGAMVSLLSALNPGLVKNLTLLNPAGFSQNESRTGLIAGFAKDKIDSVLHKPQAEIEPEVKAALSAATKNAGMSFGKEIAGNPKDIPFRLNEIGSIAGIDLLPILQDMKKWGEDDPDSKTVVNLINAHNDGLFTSEMYAERLGEDPSEYVDSWADFSREGAGHTAPGTEQAGHMAKIEAVQTGLLRQTLNDNLGDKYSLKQSDQMNIIEPS